MDAGVPHSSREMPEFSRPEGGPVLPRLSHPRGHCKRRLMLKEGGAQPLEVQPENHTVMILPWPPRTPQPIPGPPGLSSWIVSPNPGSAPPAESQHPLWVFGVGSAALSPADVQAGMRRRNKSLHVLQEPVAKI